MESFAILDDESDMGHLGDRHVKTDLATGLLDHHVDQAITLLWAEQPLIILPGKTTP